MCNSLGYEKALYGRKRPAIMVQREDGWLERLYQINKLEYYTETN